MGLILEPLFDRLGFATEVEIDLASKEQRVDLVTVQRQKGEANFSTLPPLYWQAFKDLNEHNLISFKSYSESFNEDALEEFWGHFTNYKKTRESNRKLINLYAIAFHYSQKLFREFEGTKFLEEVQAGEIYDLKLSPLKKVRFILTQDSGNPILSLFSGQRERVLAGYQQISEETGLDKEINPYYYQLKKIYGEEAAKMYTKEDYFRDYGDKPVKTFWAPWEEEYIK